MTTERYISRRYLNDDGVWYLFCRSCGKHRPEIEFYNKKNSPFGKDSRCKIHFNTKEPDDDGSMNHLKLNPLTEDDFKQTKEFLIKLGYSFDTEEPIHIQFEKRHNLIPKL
jgi:hypothetical protein